MVFIGGILVLFFYVARLASNEIFSLSAKIIITSIGAVIVSIILKN
jgi:hypothetical protein